MDLILLTHVSVTAIYCGLLWIVQLVIYPQFLRVPEVAFAIYHQEHCRRTGRVVAPVFLLEGATALFLAWQFFQSQPVLQIISIGLFCISHGITFAVFIRLHRKLEKHPELPVDIHRLVRLNWLRTSVSTLRLLTVLISTARAAF